MSAIRNHRMPLNNSNGKTTSRNGNGNSHPAATLARTTINRMLDGTHPHTSAPDAAEFGDYFQLVQRIFEGYQSLGPDGARQMRDVVVRMSPELEPVLGHASGCYPWEEQLFTLADAFKPRPPLEYVVSGLFPIPSLSIVYGLPGTFKSMLLADMAICVAAGLPWLKPLPDSGITGTTRATKAVNVLWIDFDNGPRRTHERIEAVASAHQLAEGVPIFYLSMPSPWFDASCSEEVDEFIEWAKGRNIRLLVIDNLTSIAGAVEENTAAMAGVMANLRRISERANAAVVVIHHQRKGNGDRGNAGDQLRGHSSINAAIDLALKVERKPNANVMALESTKTRGADVWPFQAIFVYDEKPDGELQTARFYGTIGTDDSQTGPTDIAIKAAILEVVKEHGQVVGKEKVKKLVQKTRPDAGLNRIARLIDTLVAEERLLQDSKPGAARTFTLPA